jgi:GNAT superfamily N-acetyltransferase
LAGYSTIQLSSAYSEYHQLNRHIVSHKSGMIRPGKRADIWRQTVIRVATDDDLRLITRVWRLAEGDDTAGDPVADDSVPSVLTHLLETGRIQVADEEGEIVGFASAFTRDDVAFLAQLFILPGRQSGGIGRKLLEAVLPRDGSLMSTVASAEPRAIGLYARHGMIPVWPLYDLDIAVADLGALPDPDVRVVPARPDDPDLVSMDANASGRRRAEDHRFWVSRRGGVPYWLEQNGARTGYAYIQVLSQSVDSALAGGSVRIGPLGSVHPSGALDCVLAGVAVARKHGARLSILVPGLHPALGVLLDAGFHIGDIETFMSSADPPFVDGRSYIPSGGGLF